MSCAEQFRTMAFAQLTCRESLRDVETSLSAHSTKLYAMGFRSAVKRSTLADANDSLGVELDNTVYALDASTVDLCLSPLDWAPFRSTKAAIKLHTLLDLRGAIPAFLHISDGKMGDVNVLDMLSFEAGAFYVMDRGYLDFTRLQATAPLASSRRLLRDPRQEGPSRCLDVHMPTDLVGVRIRENPAFIRPPGRRVHNRPNW